MRNMIFECQHILLLRDIYKLLGHVRLTQYLEEIYREIEAWLFIIWIQMRLIFIENLLILICS